MEFGLTPESDLFYMGECLELARSAAASSEIPVGAILVLRDGEVFKSTNQVEATGDPTAHAERLVISSASSRCGRRALIGSTLYVSLEPCPMCAAALVQARVGRLCYAARDKRFGGCRSIYRIADDPRMNHRLTITEGILRDESIALLQGFFEQRRLHSDDQIV